MELRCIAAVNCCTTEGSKHCMLFLPLLKFEWHVLLPFRVISNSVGFACLMRFTLQLVTKLILLLLYVAYRDDQIYDSR